MSIASHLLKVIEIRLSETSPIIEDIFSIFRD